MRCHLNVFFNPEMYVTSWSWAWNADGVGCAGGGEPATEDINAATAAPPKKVI